MKIITKSITEKLILVVISLIGYGIIFSENHKIGIGVLFVHWAIKLDIQLSYKLKQNHK